MFTMKNYDELASDDSIKKTVEKLVGNGIRVFVVNDKKEAQKKVLEFIPPKSEVMTMTSVTLSEMWLDTLLNESNDYISIRHQLDNNSVEKIEKQRLWAAHEWVIWSVHAVTEDGKVVIASATWSQIPSYAYGAANVLWVVGTQKIVKNLEQALDRIYEYVFDLENARAMKAYGVGSWVNKILIVNKEVTPGRIHIILVKEKLWY